VRRLLIGALLTALALAGGGFALIRIVGPTSPVISCASPPILALQPATYYCIREPSVKLRGEL
jgi:hypothetical protein